MTDDQARLFPCEECGARVEFQPGTTVLACSFCGHENAIPESDADVVELDYEAHLALSATEEATDDFTSVKCHACAAEVDKPANVTALACPFCGSNIVAEAVSRRRIKPQSVLPFHVQRNVALKSFEKWLDGLWFAPSDLCKHARSEGRLNGVYLPYWTYDSEADSDYRGQRGDHYYETEFFTVHVNGKAEQRTRQVRRTRWSPASGRVWNSFDDVLVAATHSLPSKHLDALEPWDLQNLVPYADDYLSGFRSERYTVDLPRGFDAARKIMDVKIRATIRRDIGGDEQRISGVETRHREVSFKHVLLPVWISAYRYRGKVYRFFVNARTGEVRGERPWSAGKIAAAVVLGLLVVGVIIFFISQS